MPCSAPVLPPEPSVQLAAGSASSAGSPLAPLSSGLISAVVHLSCVLLLAIWTAPSAPSHALGWLEVGAVDVPPALAELPEVAFDAPLATSVEEIEAAPLATALIPDAIVAPGEPVDLALAEIGTPVASGPVGTMHSLVRELKANQAVRAKGGAEFYGIQAAGDRFVYVVDCSSSMEGEKWQAARDELLASLRRLGSGRSFFVILFDGSAHAMYGLADLQKGLVPATEENIVKCAAWMEAHSLGNATSPYAAIRQALTFQPSALFLLTDGEFNDPTAHFLRQNNVRREKGKRLPEVAVHTIGFHTRKGQSLLRRIAKENGGDYQFIAGR
jgi:hypothetical protein